jgi:putative hemolysin
MDALVGDISEVEGEEYRIVPREDGKSYLVDAQLPFDEFIAYFSIQLSEYDKKEFTSFNTIGGFVLYQLEEIPVTGQSFEWNTFLFEVVDMDKSRIDKLLISKTSHTKSHTDES